MVSKKQVVFSNYMTLNKVIIYTDGGSRGNPGPSAIGVLIGDKKYKKYIGKKTNNIAEYEAVIFAMKKAKQLLGAKQSKFSILEINVDSELVVRQSNGEYKILDKDLQLLFIEIWNLKQDFRKALFKHIPREKNKIADALVNEALDKMV